MIRADEVPKGQSPNANKIDTNDPTQFAHTPSTMKAVRMHSRGGPEFLRYEDAPIPWLGPGDVLLRVHATGITPAELGWDETYKSMDGSHRLPSIPGHEVSCVQSGHTSGVCIELYSIDGPL